MSTLLLAPYLLLCLCLDKTVSLAKENRVESQQYTLELQALAFLYPLNISNDFKSLNWSNIIKKKDTYKLHIVIV